MKATDYQPTHAAASERDEHFLGVGLAANTYGIDVSTVREVVNLPEITRVPATPDSVSGVFNLRGKVVALVDLSRRLGLRACPPTKTTRVVVVDVRGGPVGLIVDAVTQVLTLPRGSAETTDPQEAGPEAEYIRGIVSLGGVTMTLLDIGPLLCPSKEGSTHRPGEAAQTQMEPPT